MKPAKRASCGEVVKSLKDINERCLQVDGYCTKSVWIPRRSSTDLSELMATPTASSWQIKKRADMTPSPKHDSRVKEAMNLRFAKQNSRHPNRETRSVPRAWELGINTGEATQLARKEGIPRDPVIEATIMVPDEMDEGVDTNMEQDSQMSSPKKVHFVPEDSGIGMNDENMEGGYFAPTQNEGGMPNVGGGELTREEQDTSKHGFAVQASHSSLNSGTDSTQDWLMDTRLVDKTEPGKQRAMEPVNAQKEQNTSEDNLANNHTNHQTTPKTATNSTPTASSSSMLNRSVFASTRLHPEEPQGMSLPDSLPNAPTEIIEDETLRPLLSGRLAHDMENTSYVETERSRLRKWYKEIFCCC